MATCPDVMISVQLHDWEAMSLQVTALRERLALAEGLLADIGRHVFPGEVDSVDAMLAIKRRLALAEGAIRALYHDHGWGGIMHGDDEHRAWLKAYLDKHFAAALAGSPGKERGE